MSRTYKDTKKWRKQQAARLGWWWGCIGGISPIWKRLRRKERRAKEKAALHAGRDIPQFKQTDEYDWW